MLGTRLISGIVLGFSCKYSTGRHLKEFNVPANSITGHKDACEIVGEDGAGLCEILESDHRCHEGC